MSHDSWKMSELSMDQEGEIVSYYCGRAGIVSPHTNTRHTEPGSRRGVKYVDQLRQRSEHDTSKILKEAYPQGIIGAWYQTHPCSKESDFYAEMGAKNRAEKRILHNLILAIEVKARSYGYTLTLSHVLKMIKEIPERLRNKRVIRLTVIWGKMPDAITESARRLLAKHHIRLIPLSQLIHTIQTIRENILNLFHVNDLSPYFQGYSSKLGLDSAMEGYGFNLTEDMSSNSGNTYGGNPVRGRAASRSGYRRVHDEVGGTDQVALFWHDAETGENTFIHMIL